MGITQGVWNRKGSRRKWKNYRPWEIELNILGSEVYFSSVRWKARAIDLKGSHWLCDSMTPFCGKG